VAREVIAGKTYRNGLVEVQKNLDFYMDGQLIFTPGSELSFVWKNEINDFNSVIPGSLGDDLNYTLGRPQANSYSIKLIYFLDYHTISDVVKGKVL
jgi:hypothetical protein